MKINWLNDGWTVIQEADAAKHVLEVTCFAEDGVVTEIRKRHNDGEEEKIKGSIDGTFSLPMSLNEFKEAVKKNQIKFK